MIGGTFEYLMSSLPNLSFQNTEEAKQGVLGLLQKYAGTEGAEWSPLEILDQEAGKFLPHTIFPLFQKMSLSHIHQEEFRKSGSSVLTAFSAFTFTLKKDLNAWRLSKNEKKPAGNPIGKIMEEGTPLEKEIGLMKLQWDKLEELAIGHFADMEAVFVYKIKLMILLRWWSFNEEKGFEKFIQMTTNQEHGR